MKSHVVRLAGVLLTLACLAGIRIGNGHETSKLAGFRVGNGHETSTLAGIRIGGGHQLAGIRIGPGAPIC